MTFNEGKLHKVLSGLPDRVQRRVMREAVKPANSIAVKAAKRLCPTRLGLLKRSLGTKVKTYVAKGTVTGITGPRTNVTATVEGKTVKPAKYSHLVEKGTRPHRITITPKTGPMAGKPVTLNHPGARATNFIAKAEETTRAQRVSAATEKLTAGTVREAVKLGI
jgi:hypothetical protein